MQTPLLGAAVLALALLAAPDRAVAGGDGGASAPGAARDGGGGYGVVAAPKASKRRTALRRRAGRLSTGVTLDYLRLERPQLFLFGRPARVTFRLRGRGSARVGLRVLRASDRAVVSTLDLGVRAPRRDHVVQLSGREAGLLPEGRYLLHIGAPPLRRDPRAGSTAPLQVLHHRFPLDGAFGYGGADSLFGAARKGHRHQGQDLSAPAGTPVLAPRGGVVESVRYQAEGAGHYVVLNGEDEDRHYVLMHLLTRSIPRAGGPARAHGPAHRARGQQRQLVRPTPALRDLGRRLVHGRPPRRPPA